MPLIKSAKKRMRQSEVNRERNKAIKTYMKNVKKKTLAILSDETAKQSDVITALNEYKSQVDKAWAKGIFKRNKSSRMKARIDHLFAKKIAAK